MLIVNITRDKRKYFFLVGLTHYTSKCTSHESQNVTGQRGRASDHQSQASAHVPLQSAEHQPVPDTVLPDDASRKKNKHRVKRLGHLNDNRIRRQTKLFNFVFFRPERHIEHDAFEKLRNNVRHFRLVDSVKQARDTGHNRRLQHFHIFK